MKRSIAISAPTAAWMAALTVAFVFYGLHAAADAGWRPRPGAMLTPWGEKVTPENAWREYPRPQFVREAWLNLNGLWNYAITPRNAPAPAKFDGKILVPFCVESALSGVGRKLLPTERLWYRRMFVTPSAWKGQRILLHFGAVDHACVLWVNGGLVGAHEGGFDAFSFDITDFLRDGENELLLAVTDPTDTGEQPRGKQVLEPRGIWYTPVSGIWQTVWLEPVPRDVYLAELRFTPDLPNSRLRVVALVNAAVEDDSLAVRLTASAKGQVIATTVLRVNREGWLHIPDPQLWSPENPFLYDLKAELVRVKNPRAALPKGRQRALLPAFGAKEREAYARAEVLPGTALDTVTSYFAMREVSVGAGPKPEQPHLCLNGKPIFQHGPLDQGWWPDGLHTPPSDAAMRWELEWLKRAGFNMLRKHIKVEPARYYYHCDRLGLLVWQDMPSGFNRALRNQREDEGEPFRLARSREQHELELRRMIGALYNHPSVVMWVIHNEGWGQYETRALTQWVKAIDPTRWCNPTSGWLDQNIGDVYDIHTYHEVPLVPVNKPDRAIVIGEYGGIGWPIAGHLWDEKKRSWGYQTYHDEKSYLDALRKKFDAIAAMRRDIGLSGAVYTQTSDVEGEVNGFLTYDRRVEKVKAELLAELNRKIYGTAP
ncbi:MAG: glycoside hydrolase family 2 [Verrucomicrobiae bacterium]|nr:glycoside hydrolase family 2 [Verrucomicrobiae bacterium]